MTTSKAVDGAEPARCSKVVGYLMPSKVMRAKGAIHHLRFLNLFLEQKPSAELDLSTEVATRLKLVDQDTPAFVASETHSVDAGHQRYSGEGIPRLTKVRLTVMNRMKRGLFYFFIFS